MFQYELNLRMPVYVQIARCKYERAVQQNGGRPIPSWTHDWDKTTPESLLVLP